MRKIIKNVKAISPVLSVLMMITIAVAASLLTYAWVIGYLGFTTSKAGKALQIQSIVLVDTDEDDVPDELQVYVQNVGVGTVEFIVDECFYVEGKLEKSASMDKNTLGEGDTATIKLSNQESLEGYTVKFRVVSSDGTFTEATNYMEGIKRRERHVSWWDTRWDYRVLITVDQDKVEGDLTDFPMLIDGIYPELKKAQDDFDDVLFVSYDHTLQFDHEIESYDEETGAITAWVKVDLSTSEDIKFWMYYGNSGASNQENPSQVWSKGYEAVYHLSDVPTGENDDIEDSRSNNHGTTYGNINENDQVNGIIDGSIDFDAVGDYIEIEDDTSLEFGSDDYTIEAWFRTTHEQERYIISKYANWGGGDDWALYLSEDNDGYVYYAAHDKDVDMVAENDYCDNNWHYIVVTKVGSGDTDTKLYVDGDQEDSDDGLNIDNSNTDILIGGHSVGEPTGNYVGRIDEVRISTVSRNSAWIKTTYNNIKSPETFYSVGSEESQ
jgi:FlaG/FlaF family flagellin (archaellin)